MKRQTIIGICVLALLAICAIGASSAAAAAPEFGRCVKKTAAGGSGFSDKGCTSEVASGATYEWRPGAETGAHFTITAEYKPSGKQKLCAKANTLEEEAGEKEHFAELAEKQAKAEREAGNTKKAEELEAEAKKLREEAASLRNKAKKDREKAHETKEGCEKVIKEKEAAPPAELEETSGGVVVCTGLSGAGDYSGPKEETNVTLTFSGCTRKGESCQSGATAGEIDSSTLDGELGFATTVTPPTDSVPGIALKPASGETVFEYKCGTGTYTVTGSVIGDVTANKMILTEDETFVQKNGVQKPTHFEGLPADVLMTNGTQTGLELLNYTENSEELEVNTVV